LSKKKLVLGLLGAWTSHEKELNNDKKGKFRSYRRAKKEDACIKKRVELTVVMVLDGTRPMVG
jgi:hypothetical protein